MKPRIPIPLTEGVELCEECGRPEVGDREEDWDQHQGDGQVFLPHSGEQGVGSTAVTQSRLVQVCLDQGGHVPYVVGGRTRAHSWNI